MSINCNNPFLFLVNISVSSSVQLIVIFSSPQSNREIEFMIHILNFFFNYDLILKHIIYKKKTLTFSF